MRRYKAITANNWVKNYKRIALAYSANVFMNIYSQLAVFLNEIYLFQVENLNSYWKIIWSFLLRFSQALTNLYQENK